MNHSRSRERDIVLLLFPESKHTSHFFPLVSLGIVIFFAVLGVSQAKAEETQVGHMLPDSVLCETEAQMLQYLRAGTRAVYASDPLPQVQGCSRVNVFMPIAWTDKTVFDDSRAKAVVIEVEVPQVGTRYSYRDYVLYPGQET